MVYVGLVIVDVNEALKHKSSALQGIRQRYPSIMQLFHYKKSHRVYLAGPASAMTAIRVAIEEVYAVCGEPFRLSVKDSAKLAQLIFVIGADVLEHELRHIFHPNERFARDDQVRLGWSIPGPLYGVCAATSERRLSLMRGCVDVVNARYGLHLTVQSSPPFVVPQAQAHDCLEPRSSFSGPAAAAVTEVQCAAFATKSPPALPSWVVAADSHTSPRPMDSNMTSPACLCPLGDPTTSVVRWCLLANQNSGSAPSALIRPGGGGVERANDDDAHQLRYLPTSVINEFTSECTKTSDVRVAAPQHEDGIAPTIDPLPPASEDAVPPPHCGPNRTSVTLGSNTLAHTSEVDDRLTRRIELPMQLLSENPGAQVSRSVSNICVLFGLRFKICDESTVHQHSAAIAVFTVMLLCDNPSMSLKLDLAEDMILSQWGVGPLAVRIPRLTPLQRRVLSTAAPGNISAPGPHRVLKVSTVEKIISATCCGFLYRGEVVEVLGGQYTEGNSNVCTPLSDGVVIHIAVRGIQGRGVARRAERIQAVVEESLNGVEEVPCCCACDEDTSGTGACNAAARPSSAMASAIAQVHCVFIALRTMQHDKDEVESLVAVGLRSSLSGFIGDIACKAGGRRHETFASSS
jgi:hypothetical protein